MDPDLEPESSAVLASAAAIAAAAAVAVDDSTENMSILNSISCSTAASATGPALHLHAAPPATPASSCAATTAPVTASAEPQVFSSFLTSSPSPAPLLSSAFSFVVLLFGASRSHGTRSSESMSILPSFLPFGLFSGSMRSLSLPAACSAVLMPVRLFLPDSCFSRALGIDLSVHERAIGLTMLAVSGRRHETYIYAKSPT